METRAGKHLVRNINTMSRATKASKKDSEKAKEADFACDLCDGPSKLPTSSSVKAAAVNTCKDTVPVYLNITT